MQNYSNNYRICWLQICPFYRENIKNEKIIKPNREDFGYRLCVLDKNKEIAIDVLLEQKYDFIQCSSIYFLNESYKKIVSGKRYACYPLNDYNFTSEDLTKAMKIRQKLIANQEFMDGNQITNEEYLKLINNQKIKQKVNKR